MLLSNWSINPFFHNTRLHSGAQLLAATRQNLHSPNNNLAVQTCPRYIAAPSSAWLLVTVSSPLRGSMSSWPLSMPMLQSGGSRGLSASTSCSRSTS
jgi:hypothetical protein